MAKKKLSKKNKTLLLTIGAAAVGVGFILAKAFKKKDESNLAGVGAVDIQHYGPYKISWVILIPTKGIVTEKDAKKLYANGLYFSKFGAKMIARHCRNKEQAIEILDVLANKSNSLDKPYTAYIISDRQFENLTFPVSEENILSVMTTKQKEDAITIN